MTVQLGILSFQTRGPTSSWCKQPRAKQTLETAALLKQTRGDRSTTPHAYIPVKILAVMSASEVPARCVLEFGVARDPRPDDHGPWT